MATIIEINKIEELEEYQLHWKALFSATREASFFQTLDWLKIYWRHFGADQKLVVLVVKDGRDVLGILPLTIKKEKNRLGTIHVLTYPLSDWGNFYGPIGPNPTATLMVAMRYLKACKQRWHMIDLRYVNRSRVDYGRTKTTMQQSGLGVREAAWRRTSLVELQGDWETYWENRSRKLRRNLRIAERKVEKEGELVFERYRPKGAAHGEDDPRLDLYKECVELAAKSWQGRSTTGTTLSHQNVKDFFRECHLCAVKEGFLDMATLRVNGKLVAYAYNYCHERRIFGMRMGFDPKYKKFSLGTILYKRMLEDSFSRGDQTFDLGHGSFEVKRFWKTEVVHSYRYAHYVSKSAKAQLLRMKHWVDDALKLDRESFLDGNGHHKKLFYSTARTEAR
ncbi:MAG: GNAT family N-acetyltransferase [Pirellulaceae bacterium]|nr:GNAT family N-acetyltransferase [Pirellulaceae bacterium]